MIDTYFFRSGNRVTSVLFVCLLFLFFAGCTGLTIKDDLSPSSPKGYADFANYTLGREVIYSVKDGQKIKEGSLGFEGASLRVARVPGNYDFLIEHEDRSRKMHSKPINLKIERDMLTFVTADSAIVDVTDGINDREPIIWIKYRVNISVAKTSAPMHFEETAQKDKVADLLTDPDWRARLYAVSSVEKMKGARDEELVSRIFTVASDDPHRSVRKKAAAVLKDIGIDPFKNLLFLENFEANNKRRWISSNGQYPNFYNDEFLHSAAAEKCEDEIMTVPLDLPVSFDLELVSIWKSGSDSAEYGILMGSGKDSFHYFGISGDGKAIVRTAKNNALSADLASWIKADGINRQKSNRIRVEVRGKVWNFYVNDAYIGPVENAEKLNTYTFGLRVCQGQTIAFDQLKIGRVAEN